MIKIYARPLTTAALAVLLAVGMTGCQTMAELDPTGLLGGDDSPAPESQFPTDSAQQAQADANTTTPDLASIPARPAQPDAAAQANTAQQVTAAGNQAQYSADALRAGTDAAAPPPSATDVAATRQALASAASAPPPSASDAPPSANDLPPSASDAPPSAGSAAPPMTAPAPAARAAQANAAVPAVAGRSAPVAMASAAPPPVPVATPLSASAPVTREALAAPSGAEPAVPAVPQTAASRRMAMTNPSDADLGFRPSSAPALNAGVAQWVSPPILAHYRQTAAQAGSAGTGLPAVPAVPETRRGARGAAANSNVGGDVVANLDAVPGSPIGMSAAMNGGVPPTEIIYFPGDTTNLPKAAQVKVREAAAAFRASGGGGSIKVVGHSSSRTADMPVERHLEVIFQKSQARANAVAQALIKAGVPADRVQIEAVGDSQPIFYESMPKGEAGNRRAEIFVQS
ncbi:MAG TPA: OmpA family protein [Rhizomicrobium sp.]|nr:OmpA family protein [Rhizomicrobium sp.]